MQNEAIEQHLRAFQRAFNFARQQCEHIVTAYPSFYPMYTKGGKWKHGSEAWTHWCEGFFPGILWLLHMRDRDPWSRQAAEHYTRPLEPRKNDRAVHDLGFLFLNTYLRWYRLSGDPMLKDVVIEAGRTLALRFQPNGGYLCSFLGPHSLFIDIMMDVPIVYFAAREIGDDGLREIADRHCATTARYLVREDGSCAHEGIFDTQRGRFLREGTQQGLRPSSRWSRGLAWALYGFVTTYFFTRDPHHLEVAEHVAGFYLDHTPDGDVPFWDFDVVLDPTVERLHDSSTAAIAASGLWNLALLTNSDQRRSAYRKRAIETLARLSSHEFLADGKPEQEGILLHAVYHYHKRLGVDESVIWGDHFYVEALFKVLTNAETLEI